MMLKYTQPSKIRCALLTAVVTVVMAVIAAVIAGLPTWLVCRLLFRLEYWHVALFLFVGVIFCGWYSFARGFRERSLLIRIIEQVILIALLILVSMFLADRLLLFQDSDDQSMATESSISVTKAEAIEIAAAKAKALGYLPEEMKMKVTTQKDAVVVYFAPKATSPEEMVLGGDLTIRVDIRAGQILTVQRGQ